MRKGSQRYTDDELITRFWQHVDIRSDDECWPFDHCYGKSGYGKVSWRNRSEWAHRLAYRFSSGDPTGKVVRHTCDNPPCCNPKHLVLGTQRDNIADCIAKNRQAKPEQKAHKGALNGSVKLTQELVTALRNDYVQIQSYTVVARKYNITPQHTRRIILRKSWGNE